MDTLLRRPTNAREQMPETTAFIDALRQAFGRETIDDAYSKGRKNGEFWAIEGEFVVGLPPTSVIERHSHRLAENSSLVE
ncbi:MULTISPECIES: hypothetical protein [Caballeronia]|uniref:hypothetical protein n=1 Tax=Caballeronia TaxID=1827195 RepID=UPI001FD45E87|nr:MULTISPECIES: hypothetical protein [Caballeronia]MDR5799231.1 hypothetical protein [Caballeronia sp. LZ001]